MKKLICLTAVFTVVLISAIILTAHHYKREYQIDFWDYQNDIEITGFAMTPEENLHLDMFKSSFDVYITIDCILENSNFERIIEYVHKSERIEMINGDKTAIIEFTPVVSYKMIGKPEVRMKNHKESFKYTLNGYNSSIKKYVFRCGEFEEVLEFYSGK